MKISKKVLVIAAMVATVGINIAATSPNEEKKNNLKVLPKDISHDDLEKVMRGFNNALGVRCNFCHAPSAADPKKMDFASDAKPEKEQARDMMRMTLKINKKFFEGKSNSLLDTANAISCKTCHHGNPHPKETLGAPAMPPPPPPAPAQAPTGK
ncbi:c-type cytochrome [Pinibacter soli]|uniref:Photosynthetic reaction center cytochrome c subunit n=1 Tax=Pinibacter soli TaxID=3044211 RepID=A0ABT6RIZ0_9BACT|nr:c-type cytochrome [Pinibacter soli]MDI3322542.1 c-type cytochrome [Pinibacter soli]